MLFEQTLIDERREIGAARCRVSKLCSIESGEALIGFEATQTKKERGLAPLKNCVDPIIPDLEI
ncbi:hypothetical protein ACVWY3_001981 [Bradyrhizobium sp. USDA 4486]